MPKIAPIEVLFLARKYNYMINDNLQKIITCKIIMYEIMLYLK